MRLGVLDIGSNSAQLLVVDARPGAPPLPAHAVKEPTLLGELIDPDGSIAEEGVQRVAEAVARAAVAAQHHGVDQLYPFVTAAIRDATNRDAVIERIGQMAGVPLPLGAGRLTRQFLHDDPPAREQVKRLRRHVRDTLGEVADRLRWEGDARRTVATSKTFKQLARLAGAPPQRKGPFRRRASTIDDVHDWIPKLAGMPAAKRARLRGVSHPRARQILAGAIIAHTTMTALDVAELEVSPWAPR